MYPIFVKGRFIHVNFNKNAPKHPTSAGAGFVIDKRRSPTPTPPFLSKLQAAMHWWLLNLLIISRITNSIQFPSMSKSRWTTSETSTELRNKHFGKNISHIICIRSQQTKYINLKDLLYGIFRIRKKKNIRILKKTYESRKKVTKYKKNYELDRIKIPKPTWSSSLQRCRFKKQTHTMLEDVGSMETIFDSSDFVFLQFSDFLPTIGRLSGYPGT